METEEQPLLVWKGGETDSEVVRGKERNTKIVNRRTLTS